MKFKFQLGLNGMEYRVKNREVSRFFFSRHKFFSQVNINRRKELSAFFSLLNICLPFARNYTLTRADVSKGVQFSKLQGIEGRIDLLRKNRHVQRCWTISKKKKKKLKSFYIINLCKNDGFPRYILVDVDLLRRIGKLRQEFNKNPRFSKRLLSLSLFFLAFSPTCSKGILSPL